MANATDVLIRFVLNVSITELQFLAFLSHLWRVLREVSEDHRSYQRCPRATLRGSGVDVPSGRVIDVVWSFKHHPRRGIAWVIAQVNAQLLRRNEQFAILVAVSMGDCDSYGGLNYGFARQVALLEDVPFYTSQKTENDSLDSSQKAENDSVDSLQEAENDSVEDDEEMGEDEDVYDREPKKASDAGILGDADQWWQVVHHRTSLSSEAEPMRREIEDVITASADIGQNTGACDFEGKHQLKYAAKVKELQVKEIDLFAHIAEPAHVQIMDAILPGWQHPTSFLQKLYVIALLEAALPPLCILAGRIAEFVFPSSTPLHVVTERIWYWGSDASVTQLVPSLRPWDTCAKAANKKIQILRKRSSNSEPD